MFLSSISNFVHSPVILLKMIANVKKQRRFIAEHLGSELEAAKNDKESDLDESDIKKITHYYGLAVPAILGEAFCALRGYPMTEKERLASTYQGASTGLFDDLFDKRDWPEDKLQELLERPETLEGGSVSEKLLLSYYRKVVEHSPDKGLMAYWLRKVYDAQLESKKQAFPGLSREDLKKLTIDKGGTSLVFYRSVFNHEISKAEEEALYRVGGLTQFGNDIFDVYKDSRKNMQNLVTTSTHISDVRKIFSEMQQTTFQSFYKTNYKKSNIRNFLRLFSLGLCSRCYVCLDQLEEKEKMSGGIFSPLEYSRADLICDLDKASNKWKSVRYHLKQDVSKK